MHHRTKLIIYNNVMLVTFKKILSLLLTFSTLANNKLVTNAPPLCLHPHLTSSSIPKLITLLLNPIGFSIALDWYPWQHQVCICPREGYTRSKDEYNPLINCIINVITCLAFSLILESLGVAEIT